MPYRLRHHRREHGVHHVPRSSQRLELCSYRGLHQPLLGAPRPAARFPAELPVLGRSPTAAGAAIAILGWLVAEPSRWFDATAAGVFGMGVPWALWASNRRTTAQLLKEIDLIDVA